MHPLFPKANSSSAVMRVIIMLLEDTAVSAANRWLED